MQSKERLDLTDDLAAGALGIEDLIEETKESAAHAKNALAAIGALIGLGKQARGQEGSQEQFQMAEALLAEVFDPVAQCGQAGAKGGEERRMHDKYIYLARLDSKVKMKT